MKVIYYYDYWNILRKHFFCRAKVSKKKLELGESLSRKKPNHHDNKCLTQREKKRTKNLICLPMNNRASVFENLSIFSNSKHGTDKFSNCACFWDLEPLTASFQMRQYKRGTHNASKIVKKLLFIFMGFCFSHHSFNKIMEILYWDDKPRERKWTSRSDSK